MRLVLKLAGLRAALGHHATVFAKEMLFDVASLQWLEKP